MTAVASASGLGLAQPTRPTFPTPPPSRLSAEMETSRPTPAVVNDVVGAPAAPDDLQTIRADPDSVSGLLAEVATFNGLLSPILQIDWAKHEAEHGKEITERLRSNVGEVLTGLRRFGTSVEARLESAGVPLRRMVSPPGDGPEAPGVLVVGDFAIRSGNSRFEVRSGADGRLIGTTDGKAWQSWDALPAKADGGAAMQALVALRTLSERTATYGSDGEATRSFAGALLNPTAPVRVNSQVV